MPNSAATRHIPTWVKWAVLVVVAWLAWRVVIMGMANLALVEWKDPVASLGWHPDHPKAHLELGLRDLEKNPEAATPHLRAALVGNPADSQAYVALAEALEKSGATEPARKAMEAAAAMGPQRPDVQLHATAFWVQKGDFPRALDHWNTVLRHQPATRFRLFPYLLTGAEVPANRSAFEKLLKKPVSWWSEFFVYAADHAESVDTVRHLYRLSQKSVNAVPAEGMRAYLARLQKEGAWTEAWFVWLSSLSKEQLGKAAYVYNGGFEQRPTGIGFDWIYQPSPAVVMETSATYGTTGERALHLVFRGLRIKFEHLYQYLLLPEGQYYLSGRARPDNLKTNQGMRWALYCLGSQEPLTVSDSFRGADQWTRFRSEFAVPAGCPVQVLRLELAGRIALDFDASGGIWFDDLRIEQTRRLLLE